MVHAPDRDPPEKLSWYVRAAFGAVAVLILLVCFMLWQAPSFSTTPYTGRLPIPWTREAWLASASNCYDGNRYMMLDDLLVQHPLIGMTRVELVQLLGPLSPAQDGDPSAGRYCLGREPTWEATAIDPAWLGVGFAADDRVSWIETPQDVYGY